MAFNDPRNINSLLAREIFFKDKSNRPISTNRALLANGAGGTYWADTSICTLTAFNKFRASTIEFSSSNVNNNTIWLEPGAGITFYSTVVTGTTQPIVYIASQGPNTLYVPNAATAQQTVNLNSLPDDTTFGNTLTFRADGDVSIYVSDATVTFDARNTSTLSTLANIQSTVTQQASTTAGLVDEVSSLAATVDTLLISSAVSTFWSTLIYTKNLAENTSTFLYI
jgi:hypothetical protein